MPAADWTSISNGSGVFAIIADGTAPSPPDVMSFTAGGQFFQNITGGPFKNSRISGWVKQEFSNLAISFQLALRSLNTTYSANPATYFVTNICPLNSATLIRVRINAIVAGVVTTIVQVDVTSQNGDARNTWQQYQFSAFNSGTDILLRVAQWNGAVFVPLVDAAAPIASFPALDAAGSGRFGSIQAGALTNPFYVDDVRYYSLT